MTRRRLPRFLRAFARDTRGSLLVELGMAMPVVMMLLLGGVEVARYVLLHQKLDRVAGTVGDLVAQAETLGSEDLDRLFDAAAHVAEPFDLSADGVVVVSSVGPDGSLTPRISWQRSGGGVLTAPSRIGVPGGTAALPPGFVLEDGETVIVAEVLYDYVPWILGDVTGPAQLYHRALFRPRFSSLATLN